MTNELLTEDMNSKNKYHNHKNNHTFRFKRNSGKSVMIEHCCSHTATDVCSRLFCH